MRSLTFILFAALCTAALSSPSVVSKPKTVVDSETLLKQKEILKLLWYVNQPDHFSDHEDIGRTYSIAKHKNQYTKPEVVSHFLEMYENGEFLKHDDIFSVFHHYHQASALFELLYHSSDWQTFLKTAIWARYHMNVGLYVYTLYVAVVHTPKTQGIALPPIYEVIPHLYFSAEVMTAADHYKQIWGDYKEHSGSLHKPHHPFTIHAPNYTNTHIHNEDDALAYFREDVGVNSFYFLINVFYPFWMDGVEYKLENDRRGEYFYILHKNLVAKYYSEKVCNGFGRIDDLMWWTPFKTGFYPGMKYYNGAELPSRPHYANLYEYFYMYGRKNELQTVLDWEMRLRDAIDQGYVMPKPGHKDGLMLESNIDTINKLGNVVESNPDSINSKYYGPIQNLMRSILGHAHHNPSTQSVSKPSALELLSTSMRDPAFYSMYKHIIFDIFERYKSTLKPYTPVELQFPGVEITEFKFDTTPLVTFFEPAHTDISTGVAVTRDEFLDTSAERFQVRVRQNRLAHKPFTYTLKVNAAHNEMAVVHVYTAPKRNEFGRVMNLTENRHNFVLFDMFVMKMEMGENRIVRTSHMNPFYKKDKRSFQDMFEAVNSAMEGGAPLYMEDLAEEAHYDFPDRFMLPKGNYGGMEHKFFVTVNKYVPYANEKLPNLGGGSYPWVGKGQNFLSKLPMGYPLDRPIWDEKMVLETPNIQMMTTKIYHRDGADLINAVPIN